MPLRPDMEPKDFLALFLRRKWYIVFSMLSILFAASVYCVVIPDRYKSTTTILLIPQRVPENYVRSTVSLRLEDRLATIQQQVMSRTRLLTIMDELGLFKEERKGLPAEAVLESMRKRIELQVRRTDDRGGDSRGNDAITISFVHENRQTAMLTAARLASLFIDENLKTREQQAVGTSEFLENQLNKTKLKLAAQEDKVKEYKMSFMGELPQQMEANLNLLRGLQDQLRANSDAIRSAGDRKVFLEAQVGALERVLTGARAVIREDGRIDNVAADPAGLLVTDLAARRAQLADLTTRYTDRHPDVQRLRREVEQLEKGVVAARQSAAAATPVSARGGAAPTRPAPAGDSRQAEELARLSAQIAHTDAEVASLKKERADIQRNTAAIQEKISRSPRREQEMIALTRDYENLRQSYDDLLKKKLEADISQSLEMRQKGEQFQILDPANLPGDPFTPDRLRIMGVAFLVALMSGFGGAIALEFFDPTLRGQKDFRHHFDLPVLACVPALQDARYARRKRMRAIAVVGGFAALATAATAFLLVYWNTVRSILHL